MYDDLDETMDNTVYKKWTGVKVAPREHVCAEKNEHLSKKYALAAKKRARRRRRNNSCVEDVFVVPFEYSKNHCRENNGLHQEEISSLPSAHTPVLRPNLFWRILGY